MSAALAGCVVVGCLPWCARRAVGSRGRSRRRARLPPELDVGLVLDLLDVALAAGASVPRACTVVGVAVGGQRGSALRAAGSALLLGASWDSAWSSAPTLQVVTAALEPSWTTGSAPGPALRASAERRRRARRAQSRAAAGALGVRLVLPLGLCFLPAFVLLGLGPMLLGLATGLLG